MWGWHFLPDPHKGEARQKVAKSVCPLYYKEVVSVFYLGGLTLVSWHPKGVNTSCLSIPATFCLPSSNRRSGNKSLPPLNKKWMSLLYINRVLSFKQLFICLPPWGVMEPLAPINKKRKSSLYSSKGSTNTFSVFLPPKGDQQISLSPHDPHHPRNLPDPRV